MKQVHRKLFLGLIMVMAVALFFSTRVTAGVVVEEYNPKLNGVQGVISKIEGNKITLRDEAGRLIKIGVRGESAEDKQKLRGLQVGDKVKIEGGRLRLPQRFGDEMKK